MIDGTPPRDPASPAPRVIVALDFADEADMLGLVDRLEPSRCRLKVGKELFTRLGPDAVRQLQARGFEVFLDLKFHDIPNTVAAACLAAADLGVWMVNVHCSGGPRMISAARAALREHPAPPLLIGVTVLTSMDADDLDAIGCPGDPQGRVVRLATLGQGAGLDGVVCSPREAAAVRAACGGDFVLVTPGVRARDAETGDQKRVMTPREALDAGADYLVIGRPVTRAADPLAALAGIEGELSGD